MDVTFYEVPGLDSYVCTTEDANIFAVSKLVTDQEYTLFSNLNAYFEEEEVDNFTLHTTMDAEATYTRFLLDIEEGSRHSKSMSKVYGASAVGVGFGSLFLGAAAVGVPALMLLSLRGQFSHYKSVEMEQFLEYAPSIEFKGNDALIDLTQKYMELGLPEKEEEARNQYESWSWREKLPIPFVGGPKGEHKETWEKLQGEIKEDFATLRDYAYDLSVERDMPEIELVGKVYDKIAQGKVANTFEAKPKF